MKQANSHRSSSKELCTKVQEKWSEVGRHKAPDRLDLEMEIYKKMLNIFQVGDFYYFIFVPALSEVDFISDSVRGVLGYPPEHFTGPFFLDMIHPEDLPTFFDFESEVVDFKMKLPPEKLMKYKSRYNYRIRKKDGSYLRILQQSVTVQTDEDGAVLRNLVVHTDITDLKKDNAMSLAFIGLDGEPSFLDVQPKQRTVPVKEVLSRREKEILALLAQSKSSNEIAELLFISPATVSTHRKNMHAKTGTHTVVDLVLKAMENGWV